MEATAGPCSVYDSQYVDSNRALRGAIVSLTLAKIGFYMSKSSLDYSEIAGLAVALSRLGCKPNHTNEEGIVMAWLSSRVNELRSK